jgi:tetratricopeptide (TPR) repeat protein
MVLVRMFLALMLSWAVAAAPSAAAPPPVSAAEAETWRADLRHLAAELPLRHRDLFRRRSRAEFEAAVRALDARIPLLARHQVIVELARIVALAPDGHTVISGLLYDSPARFRYLPIGLYLFRDGLHVYAADPRYARAVGGRVVRIGRASAEEAVAAVAPLIPRDNDMAVRERAPLYLTSPEVLHAVGLVDDMERVPITVEQGGRQVRLDVVPSPAPRPNNDNWALGQRFSILEGWIDARRPGAPVPLWLRDPANYFWSSYLPESRTLYAQYNEVANKPDATVAEWVRELEQILASRDVDRFVLDLRWNTGGNNYLNRPLLLALIKAESVNRPGGLYAIIGRRNFSAVQNLVNDLDNYTDIIFVGEPTAGNPNFFGDPTSIVLPNSRLVVRASTLWWQDADPRDRRQWTGPDLAVEPAFADYREGRDAAMELILRHRPQPPLSDRMFEQLSQGNRDEAVRLYRAFRTDPVNAYAETEAAINGLGYRLLGLQRIEDAIAVFALNVESYPGSANAHDSLAEAYLAAGDRERAIAHYRRVLAIDPGNANATEMLRRIESGR